MATWKEISEAKIFKKPIMDAIIQEFVTPTNAFLITDAFLPMLEVNDTRLIALRKNGAFGKTAPASLSAEHHHVAMLGGLYKEATTGYWRESILFHEDDFLNVRNPEKPGELWGQQMMGEALNLLDIRLNNRIEQLASDVVFSKGYSVAQYGVNYTYAAPIPPKYYIDMAASAASGFTNAPWISTPADTNRWSDLTEARPLRDIREVLRYAGRWGINIDTIWFNSITAGYIEDNADIKGYIQASPVLSEKFITVQKLLETVAGLKGLKVVIDDRFYNEETHFTAAATAGDSTYTVFDSTGFTNGDTLTLRNSSDQEEDIVVHASTSIDTSTPGAHVITLAAGTTLSYSYAVNDRCTKAVPYVPDNKVAFRAVTNARSAPARWVTTPSVTKGGNINRPLPGRYTWSYVRPANQPPIYAEVGAGIHGGPVVWTSGGWITLKIAA